MPTINLKYFIVIILFVFFVPHLVYADGGFVSNIFEDVFAPDQKAAISFDGNNEIMILSTKVKSNELTNFGWIIPIKSTEKPEVELGNISIFYDLSDYFKPPRKLEVFGTAGGLEAIEILEVKELDIYDITILRATDSNQLYNWLKINDFNIDENSKHLLDFYTNKDFFFIIVKIDLLNKYKDDIGFINQQDFLDKDSIQGKIDEVLSPLVGRVGQTELSKLVVKDILLDKPYEESVISKNELNNRYNLITKEEYETLRNNYSIGKEIERTFFENEKFIDIWFLNNWNEIICYNKPRGELPDMNRESDRNYYVTIYNKGSGSRITEQTCGNSKILSPNEINEMKKFFEKNGPLVASYSSELYNHLSKKFLNNENIQHFRRVNNIIIDLEQGLSNPLRISFKTTQAFYPLKISSMNKENVIVTLYIFSKQSLKDKNNILQISKTKELTESFKSKISKYLDVKDLDYVSKLTFQDNSSKFVNDVYFEEMNIEEKTKYLEKKSFFDSIIDWFIKLF
jgi:hypothetical protein